VNVLAFGYAVPNLVERNLRWKNRLLTSSGCKQNDAQGNWREKEAFTHNGVVSVVMAAADSTDCRPNLYRDFWTSTGPIVGATQSLGVLWIASHGFAAPTFGHSDEYTGDAHTAESRCHPLVTSSNRKV
jgi:hypothetical protein